MNDPLHPRAERDLLARHAPLRAAGAARQKVLLVDDEPRMLSSLVALLQGRDLELHTASDGVQALQQLQQTTFDLVVLDLGLPDIGGHEIMDFMNARDVQANVIVTSGERGLDAPIGALKRGAYDYLRKPYGAEELIRSVDNALQQRRLVQENREITRRLALSEKKYRYLVDGSPDIIYMLDAQGRFTFVNDRVRQLLDFSPAELIGRHFTLLVHDADVTRARYVLSEQRRDMPASRTVELRMKSRFGDAELRTFSHELMRIGLADEPHDASQPGDPERTGTYGVARDITDRKRADELIAYQAFHDILTDLPNRMLFKDRLGLAVLQARRNQGALGLMFIDLDRFKLINDTLGHGVGDKLLQEVALRLKACLRRCDTLARLGGDEFTAILPDLGSREDAARIAEKFLAALQPVFQIDGHSVHISASIGIALYPTDGDLIEELIKKSDVAMYHMKTEGKNGYAFFDRSMLDAAYRKIALESSLRAALDQGELEMYYQPQIDVHTRRIIGAEALMRWNHPERGLVGPSEFLPFAEENGLILPISDWMLEAICQDLLAWNAVSDEPLRLSLNLSPQYLDRGDFHDKLRAALQRHGVAPQQIEVEVTENLCIHNPQNAAEQLEKLGRLGVSVAIDDFGTGYSSLSYLHRFPVHTLKIDRSFVTEIRDEAALAPVVLAIISIAKGLGLKLVAEGVETVVQERYLARSGCSVMQGYLYHRPVPQSQLLGLIRQQAAQP